MKNIKTLLFCLFMPGILLAAEKSITLSIPGMNCPICPITVKKSLQKVAGVKSVNVIYDSKIASVSYDDQVTDTRKLQEATKNVGYPSHVVKDEK